MTYSVAVSGASGYAGGELLRLIADHPEFDVRTVTAHSNAGQPLTAVQPHLRSYTHLTLAETNAERVGLGRTDVGVRGAAGTRALHEVKVKDAVEGGV